MSDEDRYWSVRLIVYAFESEDEAREYQHKLVDAFCAMPESAGLASSAGYFEGSSFDELSRLRAEVERLTQERDAIAAAAFEAAALEAEALGDGHDGAEMAEAILSLTPADAKAALAQHRANRQG